MLAPSYMSPSEVWMERMVEVLRPDLAWVGVIRPPSDEWVGVPMVDLMDPSVVARIGRRVGLQRYSLNGGLEAALQRAHVKAVVVNYLPFALELQETLRGFGGSVFVCCHGYDITWDLRNLSGGKVHPVGYPERVRALADEFKLVANSNASKKKLLEIGVPGDRVTVVHLGVEVPERVPTRTRRGRVRYLYLGRLIDCKGPDLTILAFERMCEVGVDAELVIAGDGPLRKRCEALRAASVVGDRIHLLGAVNRETAERLFNEADVFTAHNMTGSASRQEEAFGVAIVEAMAAGLPVTTGRSGGVPEVVGEAAPDVAFRTW